MKYKYKKWSHPTLPSEVVVVVAVVVAVASVGSGHQPLVHQTFPFI